MKYVVTLIKSTKDLWYASICETQETPPGGYDKSCSYCTKSFERPSQALNAAAAEIDARRYK